jgi:DNA mismatch repair ATPase MutL
MEKWIKCKECGHEFSNKLSKCPECGKAHLTVKGLASLLSILVIVIISVIGLVLGFSEKGGNIPTASQTQSQKEEASKKNDNKKEENSSSKSEWTNAVSNSVSSESSKVTDSSSQSAASSESSSSKTQASSQSSSSKDAVVTQEKNYEIGLTLASDARYVTIPKYYLEFMYLMAKQTGASIEFDDFAYSMNSDRTAKGVSRVIKNPNGAATYVYSIEKHIYQGQDWINALLLASNDLKNTKYVEKLEHKQYFNSYDIVLSVEELTDKQQSEIFLTGLVALEYQYFRRDSDNSVVMNFTYSNGETETIYIEEIIQQTLDSMS